MLDEAQQFLGGIAQHGVLVNNMLCQLLVWCFELFSRYSSTLIGCNMPWRVPKVFPKSLIEFDGRDKC